MRKILTFASAIIITCAAHAANYVWGLGSGDYQDHSGNALETGTAFFYLGTVTASASAFDVSAATYIASAGFDSDLYGYGAMSTDSLQSSEIITSTAAGQAYSIILLENSGVSTIDGYDGYYTIINGSSVAGVLPGTTPTYYADFSNFTSSAYTTSQMSGGAVPEPTSGLLMLLGVAGLALKRKRA